MPSSSPNSRLNATVINIHSPNDEVHSVHETDSFRRSSNASKRQQVPPKLSPKVEEYRKIIQHIVGKILKRKKPPTALFHLSEVCRTSYVSDQFENEDTIDLLIQLRSALMVCHQVGLSTQVLMQGERTPTATPVSSKPNSPSHSPRLGSPSHSAEATIPTLQNMSPRNKKKSDFETILHVLSDIILNDSRFKTANPKPSRPPYTMQTILIDIALILVQIRDDPSGLYHIGTVFLPAFESFSDGQMLGKLLSFFLDNLLPKLMQCKDEPKSRTNNLQKQPNHDTFKTTHTRSQNNQNTPTINIQSPEQEHINTPTKISHLTIDTRLYPIDTTGPSSSYSPAGHSTASSINNQSVDTYYAYALFTPLLYFMIQYLDPYLAAQSNKSQQENLTYTLTRQANSIHNFHRALSYMISCKPDLYLDILDIISNSTSEVKYRACQILFYYYFVSVGHIVIADPLPPLGTQEELELLDQHRKQQEFEEQHQKNSQFSQHAYRAFSNNQPHLMRQGTSADSLDEDLVEDHHVWYPHMFDLTQRTQSQSFELGDNYYHAYTTKTALPLMVNDDINKSFCKECFKPIKGFGLRCYQCKGSVHYSCFSGVIDMKEQAIMFYVKAGGIQKVVTPQFCHVPPQLRFRDLVNRGILGWTMKSSSSKVGLLGHMFQLVNLYTLVICACCGLPLWGISQQGYRCTECNRFVHSHCLAEAEEKNGFFKTESSRRTVIHSFQTCLPFQPLLESDIEISQADLSKNFIEFYDDAVPANTYSLEGRSFEEVCTILNVLLLQERILHYGVATGCILITQESDDPLLSVPDASNDESGDMPANQISYCSPLTSAIKICFDELKAKKYNNSTFIKDFYGDKLKDIDECLLSKEEFLSHLSAMMKCLITSFPNNNLSPSAMLNSNSPASALLDKKKAAGVARGFLQVSSSPLTSMWDDEYDDFHEGNPPNEYLDRSVLLSWTMTNLNFKSQKNAELLLQHMRNMGLFERFDASAVLFTNSSTKYNQLQEQENQIQCIFPVPYAIDCSSTVESLINSIDACLQDIDLSINECGLLMLVRRCWPDPFMSRYTQERLIRAIVAWTFDEDERLLALHAELTASNKNPQNHNNKQHNKWAQAALLSRMKGGNNNLFDRNRQSALHYNTMAGVSSSASSIYVTTRTALKDRYIIRWMESIHDMDKNAYTDMLFNATEDIIDNKQEECNVPNWGEDSDTKKYVLQKYEQFIRYILKLKTSGFTYTSFDHLLQRWLDRTYTEFNNLDILKDKQPAEIRHLVKLCSSRTPMSKIPGNPASSLESTNPIDIIMAQFDVGDTHCIERGMRWLTLIIHSGASIPSNSLSQIARLIVVARTPLDITAEFVKAIWFQAVHNTHTPTPHATVIDVIGYLNEIALDTLKVNNESQSLSDASLSSSQTFIKYSAALACYAYGCSLKNIEELDIVPHTGKQTTNESQNRRSAIQIETSNMMTASENTPLIKCMLVYLQYDQLNVRENVIKMFYALCYWGYGISNKNEFIANCMPQLIPSSWELLSPTYDYLSNINLGLLMKLISVDVRYFHACVFKIFEDANWEVRYQGLDNLFGLFTKMDAAFQTEWLKLLSHLGPVFSYFVGCLWDKEEYVRSKAYALIRTLGTLHLRSAFRCWEAYFLTATDRQKMSLVSLMIQLNALFPDWQVLQWESLLEALEMKITVDIIDEYTHSSSTGADMLKEDVGVPGNEHIHCSHDQQTAQSENVKVLMLTLALQMLSKHLSIDPAQIYRLKFVLVQYMNFQNCELINNGGEITVEFDILKYNPKNPSQVAMMTACIRGLKKIMDSFAPLPAETVATIASDSLEQNKMNLAENSSPGVHFIDVVLKMMNSGVDLTKLGHMMLKAWLEIVLIVVYKHNILDREYEQHIVTCMKQIIELLTEDISEENKLLILEILKCLLRRSDHLTAMVLSKQILALGRLMTKLGVRNSEPIYLKAKQFLKSAFLRFAVAGLFVLMFKNQAVSDLNNSEVDLFFVLRTVIDPEDIIPDEDVRGEIVYLRDQPVRDVIDKLMKQQMDRKAFSTVLHNTSRYVETVHRHPYSENILNDYARFLNAIIKYTADWRRADWNINPVFTMSAILLREHPYHFSILLPPMQAILRHGLQNCNIQVEAIAKLMVAYLAIDSIPGAQPNNAFVGIIVDELKNAVSLTTRLNKDTMLTLLELVLWDIKPIGHEWYTKIEATILGEKAYSYHRTSFFESKLIQLLPFFVNYMKKVSVSQQFTKKDFKIHSCIAQLIVAMCLKDPKLMVIIFGYLKLEEVTECFRFLNWFILTLLKEQADNLIHDMVNYEIVLTELLVLTFNTIDIDCHTPDFNFSYSPTSKRLLLCFLLLKSYILLKLRNGSVNTDATLKSQVLNAISFWMTLWPALRKLLDSIEYSTLFMSGNVGLSVWNMFLSLLQFLFTSRSEVVMINAYEWSDILDDLLKKLDKDTNRSTYQDNGVIDHLVSLDDFRKQVEKLKEMFDVPPIEVPAATMINQLFLELRDIMRLEAESIIVQSNNRALAQTMTSTY